MLNQCHFPLLFHLFSAGLVSQKLWSPSIGLQQADNLRYHFLGPFYVLVQLLVEEFYWINFFLQESLEDI